MKVRTRFAPSPTGMQHVGGIRTALFAWLFAKKHGGEFLLRIEDTDKQREKEGAISHLIEVLTWLGIEWNEGPDIGGPHAPYLQSQRLHSYQKYAQILIDKGLAYPDPYTEEELTAFREKADAEKRPFLYREHRPDTFEAWDGTKALRLKIPEIKRYTWNDLVRGELSAGEEALDDFILIKADGYPTYNFAHVIDDLEMEITHIMRGEEFISSTPKFLALYDALDIQRPEIATMPVILGPDGKKKLSKRDGARDILEYREEGYMPEALLNFMALLGWNPGTEQEVLSVPELVQLFDLSHVQKSGARFDEMKLLFINREWMRTLPDERYIEAGKLNSNDADILLKAVPLLKERASTFAEAKQMLDGELACLFKAPNPDKAGLAAKGSSAAGHLNAFLSILEDMQHADTAESVKEMLMPYADRIPKEEGGRGAALWPLRYALSGLERSPDPFTIISIIGLHEASSRLRTALAILDA